MWWENCHLSITEHVGSVLPVTILACSPPVTFAIGLSCQHFITIWLLNCGFAPPVNVYLLEFQSSLITLNEMSLDVSSLHSNSHLIT
jgi:hypothetical protein